MPVEWRRLRDQETNRVLLGFGHALTIDSAQGITSGEHINALPRGTAGITAFKAYTAESRHITQVHTMIAEAAVREAAPPRALARASKAAGDPDDSAHFRVRTPTPTGAMTARIRPTAQKK
jgi:hypothetical protein